MVKTPHANRRDYLYSNLETGVIVREIWNMKTLLSLSRTDNQIDRGSHYYTLSLTQSKFIDKAHSFTLNWQRDANAYRTRNSVTLGLKRIF